VQSPGWSHPFLSVLIPLQPEAYSLKPEAYSLKPEAYSLKPTA